MRTGTKARSALTSGIQCEKKLLARERKSRWITSQSSRVAPDTQSSAAGISVSIMLRSVSVRACRSYRAAFSVTKARVALVNHSEHDVRPVNQSDVDFVPAHRVSVHAGRRGGHGPPGNCRPSGRRFVPRLFPPSPWTSRGDCANSESAPRISSSPGESPVVEPSAIIQWLVS
jgi:hypothetical protein